MSELLIVVIVVCQCVSSYCAYNAGKHRARAQFWGLQCYLLDWVDANLEGDELMGFLKSANVVTALDKADQLWVDRQTP